ncbi:hypothetical protein LSCM1_04245 [Leishmania martiniquensis]|uniref:Uncharacterized protein n=1 Tax=Leishmania martiniquensis TaxID=1580590 RepID=A0A836HEY3_9TRYP|nr:hypothetical protein LSCM1_04245 [Leishmania martiniquensis]
MFGRRVFGSTAIPRTMYVRLHISSPAQATRMLPALVPLTPSLSQSVGGMANALAQGTAESMPRLEVGEQDPASLKALLESISPLQLGFSRLFELWGIVRATVMTNIIQGRANARCSTFLVAADGGQLV